MLRIGNGYDVHKLKESRELILGGVKLEHTMGLDGHSDADVLVHAIMDAILGACALGDIGKLFPDNDNAYLGADSIELLKKVCAFVKEKGFAVNNVDSIVVAQKPKLAPHIEIMRKNIAAAMEIDLNCVSIKATTEEKLGFTGRQEGISAHAVCLVEQK